MIICTVYKNIFRIRYAITLKITDMNIILNGRKSFRLLHKKLGIFHLNFQEF